MYLYRIHFLNSLVEEVEAPRKINLERSLRRIDSGNDLYVSSTQDHSNTVEVHVQSRTLEGGTGRGNHTPTEFDGSFPSREVSKPKVVNATYVTADAKDRLQRAIAHAVAEATPGANKLNRSRPRPNLSRVGNSR